MKIAIINLSGNVGKSTIAKHLLGPRMPEASVFSVESINADEGGADDTVTGKQFGQLQETILTLDDAIVDIGSSNVEDFVRLMARYHGSHEDFDIYLIPVVGSGKEMRDTIRTIQLLRTMGVEAGKLKVVFNRLEPGEDIEDVFGALFAFADSDKKLKLNPAAAIEFSPIYQRLQGTGTTIDAVVADETDWKAKLKLAPAGSDDKHEAAAMISRRREAITAKGNLDAVFAAISK